MEACPDKKSPLWEGGHFACFFLCLVFFPLILLFGHWQFADLNSNFVLNLYRTSAIMIQGLYIFKPIFYCGLYRRAVSIKDNLCSKVGNSSIFGPEICGLQSRVVSKESGL